MKVKVSDYVMAELAKAGVEHVFTVCGGGSIFLCDSLARSKDLKYVACHHEQAAGMAAEGYARARTGLGACLVTSGPGGTNAVTACAGCWTDSVPVVFISGQVFSSQMAGDKGVRTLGVQEIDIVSGVKHITKYVAVVEDPQDIVGYLAHALHVAKEGRPGPVWLDIPADVQKAEIEIGEPLALPPCAAAFMGFDAPDKSRLEKQVEAVLEMLLAAKRPVIHVGQGVRLARAEKLLLDFLKMSGIPVMTARNANDLFASDHPNYIGRPGTFAQRCANFAVQTCDCYLAIGTRLCLAQTGYNAKDYARNAKIVQVDIDRAELDKDTVSVALKVQAHANEFLEALVNAAQGTAGMPWLWSSWLRRCKAWQEKYPAVTDEQRAQKHFVNSYHFIDRLSDMLGPDDIVVTDMGFAFQNTHQAFRVKHGQRLFTNGGLAAMGWGLPAAIGAAVGTGKRVVCIAGDGGFMFNMQELATLKHHRLPVKIFMLNNGGYLTMRQSQEHAFETYMGSDEGSGISFPDFRKVAEAHGIQHFLCHDHDTLNYAMRVTLEHEGPVLCELMMDPKQAQIPKSVNERLPDGSIRQTALEDAHPFMSREQLAAELKLEAA